ncbi:hypothetical protein F4604DRAFT_470761 [Suillus subluteus]|nr:hypothetical protein F4604DRAFT_470761 [Suillus subluteus]
MKVNGCHSPPDLTFSIHVCSPRQFQLPESFPPLVFLISHEGRLDNSETPWQCRRKFREPHVCGSLPFVLNAMKSLQAAGVRARQIKSRSTHMTL